MTLPFPAYQGADPFIFVSYAHEDADAVFAELQWIQSSGFNIWYDEGIGPGHHWPEQLAKSIENCALFLFFITPGSVVSRNCQREINYALGKDKPFLAVYLTDTELPSGLALELGDLQAIIKSKFSVADYQQKLKLALASLIEPGPVRTELEQHTTPAPRPVAQRRLVPLLIITVGLSGIAAAFWWQKQSAEQHIVAVMQSWEEAVDQENLVDALVLSRELELTDSMLATFSMPGELITEPAGATVAIASYPAESGTPDNWTVVGKTPLKTNWPLWGFRVRLQLEGFSDQAFLMVNPSLTLGNSTFTPLLGGKTPTIPMIKSGQYPADMVYVPAGKFVPMVMSFGIGPAAMVPHGAFLIDKYEVTNRHFQEFVDAGGYNREEFWVELKSELPADDQAFTTAVARFTDSTGRLGPATWESGRFTLGQDDFPVAGVSWFEAAAYARYANKVLPALAYWARAAFTPHGGGIGTNPHSAYIVPASNFEPIGLQKVTELRGLSPSGTFGQAGNVREWISNTSGTSRWIVGGAVGDETYMSTNYNSAAPMNRDIGNGFRLMRYLDEPNADLLDDQRLLSRSSEEYTPVSDEVFATFREQFQYDRTNLAPSEPILVEANSEWTWERISIRTGYDDTRFDAHIIRPTVNALPQTVVYLSGSNAVAPQPNSFDVNRSLTAYDFILRSGRSVVVVELYESYSRSTKYLTAHSAIEYRQWMLNWYSDLSRALDYLQTKPDIFGEAYTYYGLSLGASSQLPLLALEPRFNGAILLVGGVMQYKPTMSLLDNLHYIPRITMPILFLGARQDSVFPVRSSQQPFIDLVGTPPEQMTRVSFDGSHTLPPRRLFVREVVNWLDALYAKE